MIVSIAPFFTAILANWMLEGEKPKGHFFIGFLSAIIGIFLISFNGTAVLNLNPIGDILILMAAIVWAVYSILSRKISQYGYHAIQTTRRMFCYGLLFMIPTLYPLGFSWQWELFSQPIYIFNMLFLGLTASALCFVTWNVAVTLLGAVKTSNYIYLVPVITVVTSVIILGERVTWMSVLGIILTLAGLFISEKKSLRIIKEK